MAATGPHISLSIGPAAGADVGRYGRWAEVARPQGGAAANEVPGAAFHRVGHKLLDLDT